MFGAVSPPAEKGENPEAIRKRCHATAQLAPCLFLQGCFGVVSVVFSSCLTGVRRSSYAGLKL